MKFPNFFPNNPPRYDSLSSILVPSISKRASERVSSDRYFSLLTLLSENEEKERKERNSLRKSLPRERGTRASARYPGTPITRISLPSKGVPRVSVFHPPVTGRKGTMIPFSTDPPVVSRFSPLDPFPEEELEGQ